MRIASRFHAVGVARLVGGIEERELPTRLAASGCSGWTSPAEVDG